MVTLLFVQLCLIARISCQVTELVEFPFQSLNSSKQITHCWQTNVSVGGAAMRAADASNQERRHYAVRNIEQDHCGGL